MTTEIGARVGAILNADETTVRVLGYGTYQGERPAPAYLVEMFSAVGMTPPGTPVILLDSGQEVLGSECWWGTEAEIRAKVEQWEKDGRLIQTVDIQVERAKAEAAGEA